MLQFGDSVLESAGGVQQGDLLGPLLFACAIQSLGRELRASALDLSLLFLDDGVIAGTPAVVGQALAHVEARAAAIGLRLNLAKSVAVLVGRPPRKACGATSLKSSWLTLLGPPASAATWSYLVPLLATMPSWNSTRKLGQTRQLLCWTPSWSLTTRKWACAFCAPAPTCCSTALRPTSAGLLC